MFKSHIYVTIQHILSPIKGKLINRKKHFNK